MRRAAARAMAATLAMAALAFASGAGAATPTSFSGGCAISGPILPMPPITVVPRPNPHFTYRGSGTCQGRLGHKPTARARLTFKRATTLFDTCELGPDFNLPGRLRIHAGRRVATFHIVVNLARIALFGPFTLTTAGGGRALGTAQFAPPDNSTAVQDCLGNGIARASLSARFSTTSPLVGALRAVGR